jgi:hypothetical protein
MIKPPGVKPSKANTRPFQNLKAQHITIQDMEARMEAFVKKHSLGHHDVMISSGNCKTQREAGGRWRSALDLEKFMITFFDAYGDGQHYGTMWTNVNNNTIGVVGPAGLHWKQKWKTDDVPEQI